MAQTPWHLWLCHIGQLHNQDQAVRHEALSDELVAGRQRSRAGVFLYFSFADEEAVVQGQRVQAEDGMSDTYWGKYNELYYQRKIWRRRSNVDLGRWWDRSANPAPYGGDIWDTLSIRRKRWTYGSLDLKIRLTKISPFGTWYLLNSEPDDAGYSELHQARKEWSGWRIGYRWQSEFERVWK
jgi:hypothetical protein